MKIEKAGNIRRKKNLIGGKEIKVSEKREEKKEGAEEKNL